MKITYELDLENFEAWSGAVDTLDRIISENKCDLLEQILEDTYPEGMTETELNDLLWFDDEWLFDMLGIRSEKVIKEELEEAKEELEAILEDYNYDCSLAMENFSDEELIDGTFESAKQEIFYVDYKEDIEYLNEKIKELEEELENLN